jgi:flagellar L-ring protein FlgH
MRFGALITLGLLAVSAAPRAALAQNNSLLGANRRTVNGAASGTESGARAPKAEAVSQNSTPQAPQAVGSEAAQARAELKADRPEPRPNAMLLVWSPFAVAAPQPEKIKVHDLVTIIVRESKTVISDAKLKSKKDWNLDSALTRWIFFTGAHTMRAEDFEGGAPGATFDYKNDYQGNGKYDRTDELTTRVTARVLDVKPNGNLVLEAKDDIRMDEEGYTITLIGECRARDVTPQNTILSTQITDRQINVQHHGAVRDATRRGWIQRSLDMLRLF